MKPLRYLMLVIFVAALAVIGWLLLWQNSDQPEGFSFSNGRIEAEQVTIASKQAGRIAEVLVKEGDQVKAGDVLVRLDNQQLLAKRSEAMAMITQAELAAEEADAAISQRQSLLKQADADLKRARSMYQKNVAPKEKLEQAQTQYDSAVATLRLAEATKKRTLASVDAARAGLAQLETLLDDTEIRAPRNGRVQYKLVNAGEVIAAGGHVVTLLDTSDVYMELFLTADIIGQLRMQDEARIILDPAPEYVIPARITFIAADAQFTPKQVETREARADLIFRIKISIDEQLLTQYQDVVKTGVRGIGWVRTDAQAPWPQPLQVKLPAGAPSGQQ